MRITWDAEAGAVYIYLPRVRHRRHLKTVPLDGYEYIYLDYNSDAELVGIEILNADVPIFQEITLEEERDSG